MNVVIGQYDGNGNYWSTLGDPKIPKTGAMLTLMISAFDRVYKLQIKSNASSFYCGLFIEL